MPIYLCTCCGCSRYSTFSWDIYLDSRVVLVDFLHIPRTCTTFACVANIFYFGDLAANLFVHMPWMLREFRISPGQQGLFFSGFLDTTSCRCSRVSQDIYLNTVVCFFSGFCTSCRCSQNSTFSWAIYPDTGVVIFGFSGHYIMQMFQLFLRHLHGHEVFFFQVFRTLHHADAPIFLRTFTQTQGLFFSGFPHS